MKHRLPVLALGCTVLLSTLMPAVSVTAADVTTSSAASSVSSSSASTGEVVRTKDLLNDVFVELGGEIAVKTYDECITYLNENGFSYTTTEASETSLKSIIVNDPDRDGYTMKLIFSANSDGEQTTTMITYSNTYFKACVTDGFHTDNVSYYFYDYTISKPQKQVYSLYTLRDYFLTEVPGQTTGYQNSTVQEELNVTFNAECEKRFSGVRFHVTTNLPDDTTLNLLLTKTLDGDTYHRSYQAVVKDGKAVSSTYFGKSSKKEAGNILGFSSDSLKKDSDDEDITLEISDSDGSMSGNYTLTITMDLPKNQDASVTSVIGVLGENLTGQYVVNDGISTGKTVQATFKFTL